MTLDISQEPIVSILIPVYNGANYMREAIDSALRQDYPNVEVIVVNDGSNDETEQIALGYGDRIRYFKKENGGQSSALNFGIGKMTGDYFSWLSHDDVYYPEKIRSQIAFLATIPEQRVVLYCDYEVIDKNSNRLRVVKKPPFDPGHFRYRMLISSPINGCTALIPRKLFDEIGMFNVNRPHTSDVELFFKFAKTVTFVHQPQVLVKSRYHQQQATFQRYQYHIYECNQFLCDAISDMDASELEAISLSLSSAYLTIAKTSARAGFKIAYRHALSYSRVHNCNRFQYLKYHFLCRTLFYMKKAKLLFRTPKQLLGKITSC